MSTARTYSIAALMICMGVMLDARTIKVGAKFSCKTIHSAIEAARDGDTIQVFPGKYSEGNISIKKRIHLAGSGMPVLDGENKHEIITVLRDSVSITGMKFMNSGRSSLQDLAAIKLSRVNHVLVSGNELENNYFGIYLAGSSQCAVVKNKIKGSGLTQQESGNGIHLWKCSRIRIEGNESRGHRDGIYFEFVTESRITGNTSEKNLRYGLHFMFSDNDTYCNNIFRSNGAGVAVMYTKNVKMYHNLFELNWGSGAYGILLKDIRDSEIKNNVFKGNTTGIYAESVSRVTVAQNSFNKNGWAMRITSSCDQVTVTKNNFIGNTFDMASNTSALIAVNSFDGNYWDKYDGYDLNKDSKGDVPYFPVCLSTMLVEKNPTTSYFLHSFVLDVINNTEKVLPTLTPQGIKDNSPAIKKFGL